MGSYRAIVIGPPNQVSECVQEVCEYIGKKDKIKNTQNYENISVEKARKIHSYESFFEEYPYLYHLPWEEIPDYLNTIEKKGYDSITGTGIWFVCYNYSPGSVIENKRSKILRYMIEDGADGSITPFSYDSNQDFKTDM